MSKVNIPEGCSLTIEGPAFVEITRDTTAPAQQSSQPPLVYVLTAQPTVIGGQAQAPHPVAYAVPPTLKD